MHVFSRFSDHSTTSPNRISPEKSGVLPAFLRERDLALLIVLISIVVPDIRGEQFAGPTAFFYWVLAFVLFQIPSVYVFRWLLHQAPRRVPFYVWALHFVSEKRWRPAVCFLIWWMGVLVTLMMLGVCLALFTAPSLSIVRVPLVQDVIFAALLGCATLLALLPLRLFRIVVWTFGLLYLAFFALLALAILVYLMGGRSLVEDFPQIPSTILPAQFSWSLFALALFSMFGINGPLLLDGEMRGKQRFLRAGTGYLWWGALGSLVIMLVCTMAWLVMKPPLKEPLYRAIGMALGPGAETVGWLLLALGSFGSVLAFLLVFSRAFLLAARWGYLPRALAQMSRSGIPRRAILAQSALIAVVALFLLAIAPALLREHLPTALFSEAPTDDQFALLVLITNYLWCLLTLPLFFFAFWLFWKKRSYTQEHLSQRLFLPLMCLSGILTSLVYAFFTPLQPDWPKLLFSTQDWFSLVLFGLASSLVLAWGSSELPRRAALVREKEQHLARERALRTQLQQAYTHEHILHTQLQASYAEQQMLTMKQQLLLDEINRLYHEEEQRATTDAVTGLLNHRAFLAHLENVVVHCQHEGESFLLVFLDIDHFKVINDTWGHQAGDAILHEVAGRLQQVLCPGDVAGRYGGEEFTLLLLGSMLPQACEKGEFLRQLIGTTPCHWQCAGEAMAEINVTMSIGIASYGCHGTQPEELIDRADQAMYWAKLHGRNRVCIASVSPFISQEEILTSSASASDLQEREYLLSAEALQSLYAAIQAHTGTTSIHASRIVCLAEETGRRVGASAEDLFLMRLGGLFRDIGKLGIAADILHKTGPLNQEEWGVIRRHPLIGAHLLERLGGIFVALAPIVRASHERWDGSGYPQGLQREEIPLASRVLSVVDAYDAMVSRRSYKAPMSPAAALAELRAGSGSQFDPLVVQAFLSLLEMPVGGQLCPETLLDWNAFLPMLTEKKQPEEEVQLTSSPS